MSELTIFFATNRDYHNERGKLVFTNEIRKAGAAEFRVGEASVRHTGDDYRIADYQLLPERRIRSDAGSDRIMASADLPAQVKIPLARQIALQENPSRDRFGSTLAFQKMQTMMHETGGDALLLVPDFACTFDQALQLAAELKTRYSSREVREMAVGVFAWPADGRIFPPTQYYDERQDALLSGLALARLLCRLRDFIRTALHSGKRCVRRLHLLAHGMGVQVLHAAVQSLTRCYLPSGLPLLFQNIFLMAADDDNDALEKPRKLGPLTHIAKHIHVYHSQGDCALSNGDAMLSNPDRLGVGGPAGMTRVSEQVTAIDCSGVDAGAPGDGNHQYFRQRTEVIDDILQVLAGRAGDEIPQREAIGNCPRRYRIRQAAEVA